MCKHVIDQKCLYVAILIFHLLISVPIRAQEWSEIYQNGTSALAQGDWDKAISQFNEALKVRPNSQLNAATVGILRMHYLPYYNLGQAYFFAQRYELALDSFQKSLGARAIRRTRYAPILLQFIEITGDRKSVV